MIFRVYDQNGTPKGYFLLNEEELCRSYCYIYGYTYQKEKL